MAETNDRAGQLAKEIKRLLETVGVLSEWDPDEDNVLNADVAGERYVVSVVKAAI